MGVGMGVEGRSRGEQHLPDSSGSALMEPKRHCIHPHFPQGWTSIEDSAKGRRGTGAGKVFSSLAAPTAVPTPGSMLQPMYATHPNETRLQELLDLQRRKLGQGPGPGQYDVSRVGSSTM